MRANIISLIKFCGTRTDPAVKTKSMGLSADAQVPCFFARHQDYFVVIRYFAFTYRDLVPSNSFIVTLGYSSTYRDSLTLAALRSGQVQKTRHPDPPAGGTPTHQTAGPLEFISRHIQAGQKPY
jgi:hypothetical protein